MNYKQFLIKYACMFLFAALSLTACNDYPDVGSSGARGITILPNPMEVGQTISITGADLQWVIEIVFPDQISESAITHIGNFQIDVKVPVGTVAGNIILKSIDGDITVPDPIRMLQPEITSVVAKSGESQLGPLDIMIVRGKDLQNITEIIFPGSIKVTAIDFIKKTNESIFAYVPIETLAEIAKLEIITISGRSIFSPKEVDFTGEGSVGPQIPEELLALVGETGVKVWTWDDTVPDCYGMGDAFENYPTWWTPNNTNPSAVMRFDDLEWAEITEYLGATMTFSVQGTILKTRTDESQETGYYTLTMGENPRWRRSLGKLTISETTVLIGNSVNSGDDDDPQGTQVYVYDVLKLSDDQLLLGKLSENANPDAEYWGMATLWVFKPGTGGGGSDGLTLLCGANSKVWTWDDQAATVWGNGEYLRDIGPAWWTQSISDMDNHMGGNGEGATMTFSRRGNTMVKDKNDGSPQEEGYFNLDMNVTKMNQNGSDVWSIGQLTTDAVTILVGKSPNEDNIPVYTLDILKLTASELVVSYASKENVEAGGGEAWYWVFRMIE